MGKFLLGSLQFSRLPRTTEEKRQILRDWVHTIVDKSFRNADFDVLFMINDQNITFPSSLNWYL